MTTNRYIIFLCTITSKKTLKDRLPCTQQERYNFSLKTSPYPLKVSSATNWVQYYTTEKEE